TTTEDSPTRGSPATGGRDGWKPHRRRSATGSPVGDRSKTRSLSPTGGPPPTTPPPAPTRWVPAAPRRHGEVLDTLVVAWRDAWRLLRGGPPVETAIGVKTVRPADETIQAAEAARRQDHLRWHLWLQALRDGTISIPGRADREL